jgi:hypothetical protein
VRMLMLMLVGLLGELRSLRRADWGHASEDPKIRSADRKQCEPESWIAKHAFSPIAGGGSERRCGITLRHTRQNETKFFCGRPMEF